MRRIWSTLLLALAVVWTGAALGAAAPARADVQDFSYDSWHVEYEVGVDESGRALAHVTETLVARFPDFDQNKGLVRGLPLDYQGTSTDPRDFRVTDENGRAVPFWTEKDGGFIAVLTGDDDYVHGVQTYVISYTLSDVILARDDGTADEFYWDLTDFEHQQSIAAFTAEIRFSSELAAKLDGNARCYSGTANSRDECSIARAGDEASYTIPPIPLSRFEGVTVAIGLEPGSVAQPFAREHGGVLDGLPLALGGAAAATAVASAAVAGSMRRKRRVGRGTIVAQYDVPSSLPPLLAAPIAGAPGPAVSAQIVHLAVNGALRIEEGEPERTLLSTKAGRPRLRLLDPTLAADQLDAQMVDALFASGEAGAQFTVPGQSEKFAEQMGALAEAGKKAAQDRGYFEREYSPVARILGFVSLGLVVLSGIVIAFVLASRETMTPAIGIVLAALALLFAFGGVWKHRVHTRQGAEAREYLEGVREFIRVAEADRLRMLQSYEGAERKSDGTVDVIHVYEKLLPYAILFKLEKQWGKVLEVKYAEHGGYVPLWYPAVAAHGIGAFDSTISQFTSSLQSSASYTSSSSGGSGGGGFSGGGGGGGFSGGR
ncbi:DUF2207 domain-containing protein [Leucobacter weissii]|uniref:DUF2207 domain-containing protein n=1 Tax=Leucobacter weissii TaxID=1983706 RepID=A0A939MJ90_9MICO|nr:DUF2207 domain-containing protein [Leucobacter weissii]MBO1901968.1 DUF2207 domain-containing protein [Leucobacter weissii]